MKQQEIQERNKQIALMLGWFFYTVKDQIYIQDFEGNQYNSLENLIFHYDWNWLMEGLEFIRIKDWSYDSYSPVSDDDSFECNIWGADGVEVEGRSKNSLKEATFLAVSDFAKSFNEKKL